MTKDEALKLALEALEQIDKAMPFPVAKLAQKSIREALALSESSTQCEETSHAQPEQEPVAWIESPYGAIKTNPLHKISAPQSIAWRIPLYTTPPPCPTCEALARTVMLDQTSHDTTPPHRKPLTDEEIAEVMVQIWSNNNIPVRERSHRLARAIEAAHGIKGDA